MKEQRTCRKVRRTIQDALDRSDPIFQSESEDLTRFLPGEVRVHLEHCLSCRGFLHSLRTLASVLRNQLDEALLDYPDRAYATVLQGMTEKTSQDPSRKTRRGTGTPAAFKRFRNWLFGPAGKPAALYRWAAVSAVAVLLVSSLIGLRIYSVSRTHRAIEQQIDRVVELIYQEPLLPGIESALLRTQPAVSDFLEDMNRAVDIWLEDTTSQSYLN